MKEFKQWKELEEEATYVQQQKSHRPSIAEGKLKLGVISTALLNL